ncbi:glycosyltransferase family 4 protein [Cellulophaga baltica]|uniref:glycosyltransferase family 4 protein n=1 Tax=Cellulophaga baltica TaxID=76594 RepID=UPI0024951A2A|nr:glycosyltransferase family 1 protein [Cellulophaga baltica]
MKIVFLIHQEGSLGYSMRRYLSNLKKGLERKGYEVSVLGPKLYLSKNIKNISFKKWLRYIDQYLLFPIWFKSKNIETNKNTLYVLIDQALGIWTPLIKNKKHIIHCHDFIALKSAQGTIEENPTSWTGKIYQYLILNGFRKASNFISISKNTQKELEFFLNKEPIINAQVYNAIDSQFKPGEVKEARSAIGNEVGNDMSEGYILHVGGNTFYKNRNGVINIYDAWRKISTENLPLIMIGSLPTSEMIKLKNNSKYKKDIFFLTKVKDDILINAYQGARIFIFPSLLEGFGYPIIEAMACGCPVITTDKAPMNEIGGTAAVYIPKVNKENIITWPSEVAIKIELILKYPDEQLKKLQEESLINAEIFKSNIFIDNIEKVYLKALSKNN